MNRELPRDCLYIADSFSVSLGGRQILSSASLWAPAGQITVLLGRNGSGKSTLLRASLGLVSHEAGHVTFRGTHYSNPKLHTLARCGLYYLPEIGVLSPRISCAWQIEVFSRRRRLVAFEELAADLGLGEELLGRRPGQLSGGERTRVEIALAAASVPMCLLADEPLASVEPIDRPRILALLRKLASRGTAIVVTGHSAHELLAAADNILWMNGGTTQWLGAPDAARAHEPFQRDYLGATR